MRERLPQLRAPPLGVVRLGDRPHDDDPRRAALDHLVHVAGVEPADREPRLADAARGVRDVVQPGGAAGLGRRLRAPARPRGSRRRDRRPRPPPGRARASSGRRSGPARRARAPPPASSSSWPTCTPSAPHACTRSGRSLRMNSASWPRNASDAATSPSSSSVLSRNCTRSTPPRTAAAIQSRGRAGHTRYRRVVRRRSRGVMPSGDTMKASTREPAIGLRGRHRGADRRT